MGTSSPEANIMAIQTTYSNARANLAKLFDAATDDHEVVIVKRRGGEDVAIIAADELSSLMETAHLLRSPRNAERLLKALRRAEDRVTEPSTIDSLRREFDLGRQA